VLLPKNVDDSTNQAISRIQISDGGGGHSLYMTADSTSAIVAILQMGVLEVHPWGSRAGSLGFPDRIIFDLDPDETVAWAELRQAALIVKTLVENLGLAPFLKTTGGKGLHVVVPITPVTPWDTVKGSPKPSPNFSSERSRSLHLQSAEGVTAREIFIDYLRNGEGATAVPRIPCVPKRTRRYRRQSPGTSSPKTFASIASTCRMSRSGWPNEERSVAGIGRERRNAGPPTDEKSGLQSALRG
jgi:DNA ligase D-like protein (predicted polymerase)